MIVDFRYDSNSKDYVYYTDDGLAIHSSQLLSLDEANRLFNLYFN